MGILSYGKTVWKSGKTGGTAWTPTRLNNIENGIEGVVDEVNSKETRIKTLESLKYAGSASAGGAATTALSCTGNAATATTASACTGNAVTASKLATARTINNVSFDGTANITIADSTKAPTSHSSTATTYGIGGTTTYGHVKTINGLTQSSHADGTALSAYQGYLLQQNKRQSITANAGQTITIVTQIDSQGSTSAFVAAIKDLVTINYKTNYAYGGVRFLKGISGVTGSSSTALTAMSQYAIYSNAGSYPDPITFSSASISGSNLTLKFAISSSGSGVYYASTYEIEYTPSLTAVTLA